MQVVWASGALLEIEAQAAREELNIVDAKNQLQLAKLKLAQMLELVFTDKFDVEIPYCRRLVRSHP